MTGERRVDRGNGGANDVAIWHIDLAQHAASEAHYWLMLSDAERTRAQRLKVSRKRTEYVVVRAMLRHCLATQTACVPQAIEFAFAEHGKPFVRGHGVHFNVSHSHGYALIAIASGFEVGIDVEKVRPGVNSQRLARRFFSPLECQTLGELAESDRARGFFTCWARKEAVIKCDGRGVSIGLDRFDVSIRAHEPARLLRTGWDTSVAEQWSLLNIDVGADFQAALAARTRSICVTQRRLQPVSTN
ncbi:MAG: 4'-phosphopantetheinyl transferase superfamily protein [Gammaproteobacteria bacterium]|nr:4'-phosphopantetheinyl transferase superfamily protein [Gammaproteobacteria bacterium]